MNPPALSTISCTVVLLTAWLVTGCGPSRAELERQQAAAEQQQRAQAETQRQAQAELERQRQAEEAARVKRETAQRAAADAEARGQAAEAADSLRVALDHYRLALQAVPPEALTDIARLRAAAIRLALRLDPRPVVPPEATEAAMRGEERLRIASSEEALEKALADYDLALRLAPWWADAYFNQALVLEKTKRFAEAREAFRLFLQAAPGSPDEAAVRRRMIALEIQEEELRPTTRLVGAWREQSSNRTLYGDFAMSLKGTTLTMTDREAKRAVFTATVSGSTFAGTYYIRQSSSLQDHYRPYCTADFLERDRNHDVPITGTISDDGTQLAFRLLMPRISIMGGTCRYEGYLQWDKVFARLP